MSIRTVAYWAALVVVAACAVVGAVLWFTHLDMTRQRLFVTYWPVYVVALCAAVVALFCHPDRRRRR